MVDKFYKTVFTIEVLSDKPVVDLELEEIAYEIMDGDCVGRVSSEADEITKEQMKDLLIDMGSDPRFLLGEEENG